MQGLPETVEDRLDRAGAAWPPVLPVRRLKGRALAGGARFSLEGVDEVHIGRGDERTATMKARRACRLTLSLRRRCRALTRCCGAPLGWYLEDPGSRNGSYLNGQRVERGLVGSDDILELGHAFITVRAFDERADHLRAISRQRSRTRPLGFQTLLPRSRAASAISAAWRARRWDALHRRDRHRQGEVLARAIHEQSGRTGPFVAVNCNTLTDGLAESQLFGHVEGRVLGRHRRFARVRASGRQGTAPRRGR
jgi:hypothetical protein